jgi:predicted nucleic acid-binding protein
VVVVDSSGWIEYFTDGPKASAYAHYLKKPEEVLAPVIVLYEVYKKIKRERGEEMAKLCLAQMEKSRVIAIGEGIALLAADLSLAFSLPMADAFVLATARMHQAQVVTSDADFRGISGAEVV